MRRKLITAYPQLAELSNDSLEVAEWIDKLRPSWLGYASIGEWEGKRFLKIVIPPSKGQTELLIAYDSQLTVYFADWHAHAYFYKGVETAVQRAISFADAILSEEWIVACARKQIAKGKFEISYGAYNLESLKAIPVDELIYTRSWNGTYDRQYQELN